MSDTKPPAFGNASNVLTHHVKLSTACRMADDIAPATMLLHGVKLEGHRSPSGYKTLSIAYTARVKELRSPACNTPLLGVLRSREKLDVP